MKNGWQEGVSSRAGHQHSAGPILVSFCLDFRNAALGPDLRVIDKGLPRPVAARLQPAAALSRRSAPDERLFRWTNVLAA